MPLANHEHNSYMSFDMIVTCSSTAKCPVENLAVMEGSREDEEEDLQLALALSESEAHGYPAGPAAPAQATPSAAAPGPPPSFPQAAAKAAPAPPAPPVPAAPDFSDYGYIERCTLNFAVDRVLGAGAYGTVYHGIDPSNAVDFAAKRLECQDGQQREYLERMTEAEVRVFHLVMIQQFFKDAVFRNMSSLNLFSIRS